MPALKTNYFYTMEDIKNLPEGQRAELIDGQIYMMTAPKTNHFRVSHALEKFIDDHITENNLPCEMIHAPFGVWLFNDESVYLEPDIFVVCDKDKIDEDGCKGAPDFVIEILSPSTRDYDLTTKRDLYFEAGVREYWCVATEKREVIKYVWKRFRFPEAGKKVYSFDEDIPVSICEGFAINFGELGL